jgi:hypothetical protein
MSQPANRLSRREAERLLDAPASHRSALGSALSAASAPAHPGELRREDATVAAFHTARLTPSPTSRSNYVSPTKLGSRAAARAVIATAAVVALTSGGFALANSAHLPLLPDQASDQATESVAKTPQPSETTEIPTETVTESPEAEDTEDTGTPTPSFKGLCKAYQATDHAAHGKSLDSAAFTALTTEVGSTDPAVITTYCVTLIGEPKETGKPSELPTPTAKPTDRPTGKPSVLPTPTDKPTDKPSPSKPTDKPANPGKAGGEDSSTSGS